MLCLRERMPERRKSFPHPFHRISVQEFSWQERAGTVYADALTLISFIRFTRLNLRFLKFIKLCTRNAMTL